MDMSSDSHGQIRSDDPAHDASFSTVESDSLIYVSGRISSDGSRFDPKHGECVRMQTACVLENLTKALNRQGLHLRDVVYCRCFLTNFARDYELFNSVYQKYFDAGRLPGRTTVGVTRLAFDALIQVDLVVRRDSRKTLHFHTMSSGYFHRAPFSHSVESDGLVHITGQMPTSPWKPNEPLPEGIQAQTERVMENLKLVVAEKGLSLRHAVYSRCFLADIHRDYNAFDETFRDFFAKGEHPGRMTIGVAGLAQNALVEVDLLMRRPCETPSTLGCNIPLWNGLEVGTWMHVAVRGATARSKDESDAQHVQEQVVCVMENLKLELAKRGSRLEDVVYSHCFLSEYDRDYGVFDAVYKSYFAECRLPPCTILGVPGLASKALVELDVVLRKCKSKERIPSLGHESSGGA
eukprot:TRINITY_DN19840_c0_g1_i1.p1 TRINITY_DN19840_c0_g1~~TRINITY_DN19840_c0_g1_i1.p1  ORF type:complete len:407 (+),score=37.98 TRINITY_DN19840_c0_g1_i1:122-1342(+)